MLEELIRDLRRAEKYCLMEYSTMARDAADTIEGLLAENERLQAEIDGYMEIGFTALGVQTLQKVSRANAEKNAPLREELKTVKAEKEAAIEDFTNAAHHGNILCEFCGADCVDAGNDTGGDTFQCGCFKWRGRSETYDTN